LILRLEYKLVDLFKQEAEKTHPIEACALLFGKLSHHEAIVEKVEFTPNRLQSTKSFEVDPEIFAVAIIEAEKERLDFIGLFHSHPAPAVPSSIDLKYMKLWGDALWLILSSIDGNLAAYQLSDRTIREVIIQIE
jgi:proteasome lid subunit RPN8/RPN11